ncbi:glycosyl hydrolase [Segetibacter sp. 3557_3]|uniref:glycoside hydrolase family 30 protein n=1 Tax=Segetibacter sp. 3557_3 TaxID=2547429 RepID=UPI001058911F|nr:glycoside hydrolase family 30 protein [Segetibacter sp. 3557_3]TDH26956.1 glycosyl hydrolase [Segetibacter sp. 3557_3]
MKKITLGLIILVLTGFSNKNRVPQSRANKFKLDGKTATVHTTDKSGLKLASTGTLNFVDFAQPLETQVCVFVDPSHRFQTMVGVGGAITDASAETFAKLPKSTQQEFLKAYYDAKDGIGYTLARTNINSCDFSTESYTYVKDGDKDLKTFDIQHDRQFKIPLIKRAIATAGNKLTLYVSPWSPPAWMKDNNSLLQGGKLLPQYRQSWANYYVKFIQSYEKEGMPVWGLSVQNEPMAKQRWESCIFTAEEERDFIKQYLGPTLQQSGLAAKKLIAWDHNRDLLYHRASTILDDPGAAKYVWGIGYHWYETWTGSAMQFDNLKRVAESFPTKNLFFTEGCVENFSFNRIGDWDLGERYGRSMINDFNSGTVGWTDWNILLDEKGGPNHKGNYCFAPIIADTRDGSLHYTNAYYYIGHFSKFIRPGARRVSSSSNRDKLLVASFINPDGKLAVVVMNTSDDKLDYNLCIGGKAASTTSLPHSIATIMIN